MLSIPALLKRFVVICVVLLGIAELGFLGTMRTMAQESDWEAQLKEIEEATFKYTLYQVQQGDALSQWILGDAYALGEVVPKDSAKATEWYRKAAGQGDSDMQWLLGLYYQYGLKSVPKDEVEAAKWYRESAEQGNLLGQGSLAYAYFMGKGVPQDMAEAERWNKKFEEQVRVIVKSGFKNLLSFFSLGIPSRQEEGSDAQGRILLEKTIADAQEEEEFNLENFIELSRSIADILRETQRQIEE